MIRNICEMTLAVNAGGGHDQPAQWNKFARSGRRPPEPCMRPFWEPCWEPPATSGNPDEDEQRAGTRPRSRTDLNGSDTRTWNYGTDGRARLVPERMVNRGSSWSLTDRPTGRRSASKRLVK
jgi:hypothetical protein